MNLAGKSSDIAEAIVYVVDDDQSVRRALEDLLTSVGLVVRSFGSIKEFLASPVLDRPGCLVLDVRMPGQSGLEFQQQMSAMGISLPVIFITGHGDVAMAVRAMKTGAIEFLAKPFRDQELLDAIQLGVEKDRVQRQDEGNLALLRKRWQTLNSGEQAVMQRVAEGMLNKQIAGEVSVSEVTVKVRRGQVMRKMNARSLTDLVRIWDRLNRPD